MGASYVGLALLLFLSHQAQSAPVAEEGTDLQEQESYPAEGCYYNYEHYEEGDRIVTNEPCLNCTCHNHMLMCYLRVCPFTKAIGQDCTVEKKPDQCCPVITCPEVPVQLLTSSTTQKPTTISTAVGRPDNYGCTLSDNTFYPDGAQVPSDPRKPCELCYCIRNRTACVMQECTLQVEGCQPVYQQGVCCPVRYDCDYDSVTTPGTTVGLVTTPGGPSQCLHDGVVYNDGEMVEFKGKSPCEHCYCMRGDVVCAVQECGTPLQAPDCVPLPPPPGHCCPDTFQCANGTVPLESLLGKPESQEDSHSSEIHSEETGHSDEPVNDNAAEGSESSEEQKKPQGEDSVNDSTSSGQESQNKGEDTGSEDTHTIEPSDKKPTEKPLTVTPPQEVDQENQVLHDAGEIESHPDSTSDLITEQDDQNKPELTVNTPEEEHNIIYGDSDSKPVGDINSESLVHEKPENTETNEKPELQTPIEESKVDVTKPEVETNSNDGDKNEEGTQSILNETSNDSNDLPNSSDNTHNEDDSSSSHGDESKVPEHNTVVDSLNLGEGQENVNHDVPNETVEDNYLNTSGLPAESNHSDSEETMVTGDDAEGHKQTTGLEGEEKEQQEGEHKDTSSTEIPHSYDTAHSTDGSDIHLSSSTDSNSFHEANENVQEIPNFDHESTPESDSEKNRIHGVTPETYTEVSVETVEVHTSTPEINHPQITTQASQINDSPVSTEGPAVVQNDDQGHIANNEKPDDQHEVTTITTNNASDEHDVTTMLDTGNIPRIPGEGNCIIDGQTYKHNSDVHTSNACQVSCKCLNSIVHCKLVECPPAPTQYANCMPLQDPDSCCPSYTCDDNPSLPLESHSQVSTEYPEGTDQEESNQHAQDGSHSSSDHEVPSHDQAHSSPEGSESPSEEDKKPDIVLEINEETGSDDLNNVPNSDAAIINGVGTEQNPSKGEQESLNVDNTITNAPLNPSNAGTAGTQVSGDPAENAVESETLNESKDDSNNQVEGTHSSDSGTDQSQEPNQEVVTSQDSVLPEDNPESPQQNGEGGLESQQIFEDGSSTTHSDIKPESVEDDQNIGKVTVEHDDSKPASLNENGEPDENGSDSVSHLPASTTAPSQSDISDNSNEKHPEHESVSNVNEPVDQQEGISTPTNDQTSLHKDESPEVSEDGHSPDHLVLNQISNNEVIHQALPGSDISEHSPESPTNIEEESEAENKPTESNNESSITPEGAHDNADSSEVHDSTLQESDNEPGQQNESSEKESTSQNENVNESSDEHPQNEKEHNYNESNEIHHDHDAHQDSPATSHQPEEHLNTGSIDKTETDAVPPAGNQEEPSTLDVTNINMADKNYDNPATEEHQAEILDHEVDDNSVHNEVGSEVPALPESNESSDSQTQEHDSSEPNSESESNEAVENDNNDKPHADSEASDNETVEPSSQSSHPENSHDAQSDSTPTEQENNVDSIPGDSEQDNTHEAESNAAESTNEMDKPEHDSHLKPQENIITIEDGVGGIVQHETPNEIEPIFVGEHSLPGVEHESAGNPEDTEAHHTEPALEETNGHNQDGSSLTETAPATQNTSEDHQAGSADSSAEGAHEAQPTGVEDGNNEATSSEVEESHEGSTISDDTEPQISPEEELIHHVENEPNSGDSDKNTVPSSTESEDHHEIESNEIVEGSHDLPVSSEIESGHDTSGDGETNQNTPTSSEGHSTESSEETEQHHQIGQAVSEDNLNQGTPAPIYNEEAQHDLSSAEVEDHHEENPVSTVEEQGITASNEHSDGHQEVSSSSVPEEGSHESVSSEVDVGVHDTSSSSEIDEDQNHTSTSTEAESNDITASQEDKQDEHVATGEGHHHDSPASQEDSEEQNETSGEEHHDIPTSQETNVEGHHDAPPQEVNEDEVVHSGEEHHDTLVPQEASEGGHNDIPTSQENSESGNEPSEEEHHSASQEVSEDEHTPSEEEIHDTPTSQEVIETDNEPSEEHHNIPDSQEVSGDEHVPSGEQNNETPASQEVSEGDHEPSSEEHHNTAASEEVSGNEHEPSGEQNSDTPASQEVNEGDHEPSEGDHHDIPASQETSESGHDPSEDHHDTPSVQEVSEGDHDPSEGEHHDKPASQETNESAHDPSEDHHDTPATQEVSEGDHEPSEEENHDASTSDETSDGHLPSGEHSDIPASQELSEVENESIGEEHHDNPALQENSEGGNLPSGEIQHEQNIPLEELGKEPSSAESGTQQVIPDSSAEHHAIPTLNEHHEISATEPLESPESNEDPHSPEDLSHHEISNTDNEENEQVNHDASMPASSDSDSHIPEHAIENGESVIPVDEISHHEDNVKPDLTIADHHFEENEHIPEQSSSEGTEHQTTPSDNETINSSQDTVEHEEGSSYSDATSEHQQGAGEPSVDISPPEQSSSQEIPSHPEVVQEIESDTLPVTSGSEGNEASNIQQGNKQQESTNNEESTKPLEDNHVPINEPSEPLNAEVEAGTEEQKKDQQTGLDASESENSSLDQTSTENPQSHIVGHENLPSNQEDGTNQESSNHKPGHDDNSEAAFPAEEHGGPTAGFTDSDAVINAVYAVVHQQEESNDVGDTKKPSLDQDVDITNSGVTDHEIPSISQESDASGGHERPDLTHDITVEEHDDSHTPQEHHGSDYDESLPQEHNPSIQHSPVGSEHEEVPISQTGQESPDQPTGTEDVQSIINEDSPEIPQGILAVDEHSEGEAEHPPAEETGTIPVDHKDSDHSEEVTVPQEGSSPVNLPESSDHPVHHTPESIPMSGDEEKPSSSSNQAESSTENTFTTAMHEIFGSTNIVTPEQHQVQDNEFFLPGGPLFPHWSQKPVEKVTTSKPQTVPHIPEDSQYPLEPEQDYEEEDSNYSPGTCRYGGKVYLSAQQIPRDDPCDFCFCFRSDIICLQQSCPPPIQHCYQENIPGFCCPRYECHVSMATMVNVTTTTTTTTTTLPPHFLAHAYKGHAKKTGCQVKGVAYRVGERIPSTSGPCLECRCGADGQMKCDPTVCNPQETLLRQVMDAAVISRRRRHIMTTPYFTARRLR